MYDLLLNLVVRLGCLSQTLSDLACSHYASGMGHEFVVGWAIFIKKTESIAINPRKTQSVFLRLFTSEQDVSCRSGPHDQRYLVILRLRLVSILAGNSGGSVRLLS